MDQFGLFPTFNPVSPTTRQTTRALQEIQSQRPNLLIVDGDDDIDITPLPMHPIDITDRMRWTANFDDSMVTPNPSPDEMVIQARGRRQIPLTFSPDINHTPLAANTKSKAISSGTVTNKNPPIPPHAPLIKDKVFSAQEVDTE